MIPTVPTPPPPSRELVPLAAGRELLHALTRGAALPVAARTLDRPEFERHGHCVLADVPVRGWKVRGRWLVDERQVRAAGAVLAAPVDLRDLVPLPRPKGPAPEAVPAPDDWRRIIRYATDQRGYPAEWTAERTARICDSYTLAGVRFLDLVVSVGGKWRIPRGYVALLTRWGRVTAALMAAARLCEGCGADGTPRYWHNGWRVATAAGYVTLCPPCRVDGAVPYSGELSGVPYRKAIAAKRGHAPGRYVCCLCPNRATLWDHCHDHGYVRGPLCGSCNQGEEGWADGAAGLEHLRRCAGCREADTLPARQRAVLARRHARRTLRHGRCPLAPEVHRLEPQTLADGPTGTAGALLTLHCPTHRAQWDALLSHEDLRAVVRAHVAAKLPQG
ncbi:endonuclease domain-containing protein [Streptomyces sp. HK10]|uniref:endonuclease domain-containing protein n=1 Tax=Streptomyces sp. HK10 TaxID=3373255 RepID=UPI003749C6A3